MARPALRLDKLSHRPFKASGITCTGLRRMIFNRGLSGHLPGLAHLAFVTSNSDALIERLAAAGFSDTKEGAGELTEKTSTLSIPPVLKWSSLNTLAICPNSPTFPVPLKDCSDAPALILCTSKYYVWVFYCLKVVRL